MGLAVVETKIFTEPIWTLQGLVQPQRSAIILTAGPFSFARAVRVYLCVFCVCARAYISS